MANKTFSLKNALDEIFYEFSQMNNKEFKVLLKKHESGEVAKLIRHCGVLEEAFSDPELFESCYVSDINALEPAMNLKHFVKWDESQLVDELGLEVSNAPSSTKAA